MTTVTAVLMSLMLPHYCCSGYSIASSLGGSSAYDPGSSSRLLQAGATTTTVPPAAGSEDGDSGRAGSSSHYIYVRNNGGSNNGNIFSQGPYAAPVYPEQQQQQGSPPEIAGRILFKSPLTMTTPKPLLGYRSFLSSYRNPNYFTNNKNSYNDPDISLYNGSPRKNIFSGAGLEEEPKYDYNAGGSGSLYNSKPAPTTSSGGRELVGKQPVESPAPSFAVVADPEYETDTANSGRAGEVPIVFPATRNPIQKHFYKIPGEDLSGLKNILELRAGGNGTEASTDSKEVTNGSSPTFSPVPEGVNEPACAKQLGYCDSNNFQGSYPKEVINSLLTNSISSDLFNKVFGDASDGVATKTSDVMLAGRNNINTMTQETPMCTSQEVTIYPRAAKNKDDKWMFIVNHDDYVQGVKVEKCMNEGSSCLFGERNPLGYESVCRQKFILRKLVALNGEGRTSLDTFKLPSCCVCFIKSNFISDRTGAISGVSRNPAPSPTLAETAESHQLPDSSHELPMDPSENPTESIIFTS